MRYALAILLIAAASAGISAPKEVWLTPERRAQLKAVTSRPYVSKREDLGGGVERLEWRNGSREWATTQAVRRVAGAKARNPHDDAKRPAPPLHTAPNRHLARSASARRSAPARSRRAE